LKKVFHIFFCIYFFALVFVPCGDRDDCNEINHSEIAQANGNAEHSGEVCTPLCSCACCASHFLNDEFQPTLEIVAVINTVYTIHRESKIISAIIPIWQPPELV
jgi:hypothetical protein